MIRFSNSGLAEFLAQVWRIVERLTSRKAVVAKRLEECLQDIQKKQLWRWRKSDHEILVWDYRVRSILHTYMAPHHLSGYDRAFKTTPVVQEQDETATSLYASHFEIVAILESVQQGGVISGTLWDWWAFRLGRWTAALIASVVAAALIPTLLVPAVGGDEDTETIVNDGRTQELPQEPGEAVSAVSPVTPTPGVTPTTLLDIPKEPEQRDASATAEENFEAAIVALENEDFPEAIAKLEQAIETDPGFVRAYYNLAVAYDQIGSNNQAVENYTKAIELWRSLGTDDNGLLFQAKLGRGLLRLLQETQEPKCAGLADLHDYLNSDQVTDRNEEIVREAIAGVTVECSSILIEG